MDAARAVLDFLRARGIREVTLAEGAAMGSVQQGIQNYGYEGLVRDYGLRVVDLNEDAAVEVELLDKKRQPMRLWVARTLIESDLRISVSPPKTHDLAKVTLSLKNMAVGALTKGQKSRIHQDCPAIHVNLYKMAAHVAPHLAVLDGFQAMEGNGPVSGEAVDWRIAIASADFVAADSLAAHLMGFPPETVGYLHYCALKGLGQGDPARMQIVGNVRPELVQRRFRPHSNIRSQMDWQLAGVERHL